MNDVRQNICVATTWHSLKEAPGLRADAVFHAVPLQERRSIRHDGLLIEHHTTRPRMSFQHLHQHISRRPAHIDDGSKAGEVVCRRNLLRLHAMDADHHLAESRSLIRIAIDVLKRIHPIDLAKPCLARLHRVEQFIKGLLTPITVPENRGSRGTRRSRLQCFPQLRQTKLLAFTFVQHPQAGESSHQSM